MTIIGSLIALYLFVSCIFATLRVIGIILVLFKYKFNFVHAGRHLLAKGNKFGAALIVMGFGDNAFKALVAIPFLGIVAVGVWFIFCFIKGTVTLKTIIIYLIVSTVLGLALTAFIRGGLKVMKAHRSTRN